MRCYAGSLVMNRLDDRAESQGITVAGFCFDYAAQKEQSPANMLSAMLKQAMGRLGEVPKELARAYKGQK